MDLAPGETLYSQTATMAWMTDSMRMDTNTGGGLFAGLQRSLTGGSFFITEFTADGAAAMSPSRRASPARSWRARWRPANR